MPPPLPPILYWSASLAHSLNLMMEEDPLHGLVNATGPIFTIWCDGVWEILRGNALPEDACRLVCGTTVPPERDGVA